MKNKINTFKIFFMILSIIALFLSVYFSYQQGKPLSSNATHDEFLRWFSYYNKIIYSKIIGYSSLVLFSIINFSILYKHKK